MLPPGFGALDPFVEKWATGGTAERARLRAESTDAERRAFFAASQPLLTAALDYLDTRPLAALAAADQRLMDLVLSLAHVALAIEVQAGDESRHAPLRGAMRITRSPADEAVA
jgi:hypothetical protein